MHSGNLCARFSGSISLLGAATALAGLLLSINASVAMALSDCPTTITSCGCSINAAAVFVTKGPLVSSDPATDCIDIAASGAVLVLGGNITGPGGGVTAAGIHILSGASGVFISGTSTPAGMNETRAIVGGFATGIQVDGANAEIDRLDATGNTINGVIFNNVTGGDYDNADADSNTSGAGVLIMGGSGNIVADDTIDSNHDGVIVSSSSTNRIVDSLSDNGTSYGVWFEQANDNHMKDSGATSNLATGTYLGRFATGGPTGKKCHKGMKPSSFNRIIASGGNSNMGAGIGIDLGDSSNVIDSCGADHNTTSDAIDKNKSCYHNIWMNDFFGTKTRACIH